MTATADVREAPDLSRLGIGLRKEALAGRRWSRVTLYTGVGIVAVALIASLAAPVLAPYNPNALGVGQVLQPPSLAHLMGTDELGRDIFSRALYAIRLDLQVVTIVTYIPVAVGLLLGTLAGFRGGWIDVVIMRLVDTVIALPFLVLVLAIVAIVGNGLAGVYVGVISVGWALYARLARSEMLVLREQDFIVAARGLGYSDWRIVVRHAMPNLLRSSLVFSALDMVLNLLFIASLSYLGLGVQPPSAELGTMIADGQQWLLQAWWVSTLPGFVIVGLGVSFSMIGDGLADHLGRRFTFSI